jgi:hypothetical protein
MYLQTVTRITQLGLGQPVVYWKHPTDPEHDRNPLCLVVARVHDDLTQPSWTASTATLRLRLGGFSTEVRQENLVNPYQVPWHQARPTDAGQIEQRRLLWRAVWLAACAWCPVGSQAAARYLSELGDPVCPDHGKLVLPEGAERREWGTEAVARVYAALGLA